MKMLSTAFRYQFLSWAICHHFAHQVIGDIYLAHFRKYIEKPEIHICMIW